MKCWGEEKIKPWMEIKKHLEICIATLQEISNEKGKSGAYCKKDN
jgi:hypothetical protein